MSRFIKLRNIKQALKLEPNNEVLYTLSGRVQRFRPFKNFNFVDLVDGSTSQAMQIIIDREIIKNPHIGSYLTCQGRILSSRGPKQPSEFKVEKLDFLGNCDPGEYPIVGQVNHDDLAESHTRSRSHLRPRFPHFASTLRVRSELELSLDMIMKQMDFFKVRTPCLTSNDSEATSDLFLAQRTKFETNNEERLIKESYFGKDVFLTTSSQLHLESLAASLSRVYSMTSAFRAENSLSNRHLCEFSMFEAEESGVTKLSTLIDRVESIIKFVAQFLSQVSEHKSDLKNLIEIHKHEDSFEKLSTSAYIRISYEDAIKTLKSKIDPSLDIGYGSDIARIHERLLLNYTENVPIFITNYPKSLKPFYMKTCESDDKIVECFDLIAPFGGEICGGSLREESHDRLSDNLRAHGIDTSKFDWYMELRKFGTFPHGGFGIGIERFLQSLTGIKNIRDTIAFPRWANNCPM